MTPVLSKDFLDIQENIRCGFTLKYVRDMRTTYREMHRTDKYSQHSSIIWSVGRNSWVFVYELGGCGLVSCCSRLKFRYRDCFEQEVLWDSGHYRMWIHSEMRTGHDKNKQSNLLYIWAITTQVNLLVSLAKWLSVLLPTKWLWVRVSLQSLKVQMWRLFRGRSSLTFRQI